MDQLGIIGYGAITAIAFFVGFVIKQTALPDTWIPVFTLATGAGLGLMCYYGGVEDYAVNVVEGIARGIVSGAAATGIHQIWRQLGGSKDEEIKEEEDKTDGASRG